MFLPSWTRQKTQSTSVRTQRTSAEICVRNTHQDFGVQALWEISAGQWEHSKYKLMDHIGDYTEQTAITNQLAVV